MSDKQILKEKNLTYDSSSPEVDEESGTVEVIISPTDFDRKHAVGADLFDEVLEGDHTEDSDYAKLRRKLDCRLIPLLCITYMLQFLDRSSLNYASAYNLKENLKLKGNDYGNIAAIFNVGYMIGTVPGNWLIQRVPVAKFTGCALLVWSVLLIGHIGARNTLI